jgi:hypothetical protein
MNNDSNDSNDSIGIAIPTSGFSNWPEYTQEDSFSNLGKYLTSTNVFIGSLVVVLLFFSLGSFFRKKESDSFLDNAFSNEATIAPSTSSSNIFVILFSIIIIVLFSVGAFQFFGYDIVSIVSNTYSFFPVPTSNTITETKSPLVQFLTSPLTTTTTQPHDNDATVPPSQNAYTDLSKETNPNASTVEEITSKKQVFNIPGNFYNYENAKAICSAYGSRLATYSEVEDAYKNGGEWCSYGWSDGQMALFPTQEKTFNQYQQIKGHENDCGRPGVNGGHMTNPELQFGVNCYGYKPKMNERESYLMQYQTPFPKSDEELEAQQKVNYWKNKINDILVSPFNNTVWSE